MKISCRANWTELDKHVKENFQADFYKNRYPAPLESIDLLVREGWKVELKKIYSDGYIVCAPKIIFINEFLTGFQRDVTLFHEIIHALYPGRGDNNIRPGIYNEEIVEWLARQCRTDSKLLRYAILTFGLEPQVYDKVSYHAFPDALGYNLDRQLAFPFAEEFFRTDLQRTLME